MRHPMILIVGLLAPSWAAAVEPGPSRVTASLVVKVAQRDESAAVIIAKAESLGGYFSALTNDNVVLRVPIAETETLIAAVDEEGLVVDKSYQSEDLRERLDEQRTRLAARKRVLDQYFALLTGADSSAVLTVEREIARLVSEVERLEGSIRLMEHGARMAQIDVRFQFRERTGPRSDATSSFGWLNSLDLQGMIYDFAMAETWRTRRNPVEVVAPDGFAEYPSRKPFRATSPDGVMFRVRSVDHDPEANLLFWAEAMERRMTGAGYRVVRKGDIDAGGTPGHLLELTAPLGPIDYSYAIAIVPTDKQIVIAEVVGQVAHYEARRSAVVAAIQGVRW
jgi:hypothetical protein